MFGSLPDDDASHQASDDDNNEPEAIAPPQPTQAKGKQPRASAQKRPKAKTKTATQARKGTKPPRKGSPKKQATPKQPTAYENRKRSEEDSIAYQRAVRVWELTKQWNADHNYDKAWAIQLSKSYLGLAEKVISDHSEDFECAPARSLNVR